MKLKVAAGFLAAAVVVLVSRSGSSTQAAGPKLMPAPGSITQGALLIRDVEGRPKLECPLKHTDVKADISGFLARVTVTQEFENTAADKVEAVYVFPLPHNSAIDNMTLQVGGRIVKGDIRRREEAQAIYDAARNS
ncbi:MAG: hypothetical protein H7Y20_15330, partial [Bryobacteraceae bacterium]|nr:hypothetical protein [Bryobacteraceae bacterium]